VDVWEELVASQSSPAAFAELHSLVSIRGPADPLRCYRTPLAELLRCAGIDGGIRLLGTADLL